MDKRKQRPRRVAVFGASGRLGGPLARFVRSSAPDVSLRILTSAKEKSVKLAEEFPEAEVMEANYFDATTMARALADADGVFLVTPNFLDEETAMPIFVEAAELAGASHIVRLLGDAPGMTLDGLPPAIRDFAPPGPASQHLLAHRILKRSGLPVTFINCASYLMDNLMGIATHALRSRHTLTVPVDRVNSFIDPRDVGETAACLLLSENPEHIGRIYDLDNGHDLMRFSQLADLMSEVFGCPIAYDGSPENFLREHGDRYRKFMNDDRAPEYMLAVWEFEREVEPLWRVSDTVEKIIGRAPKTMRDWLIEHRASFFPQSLPNAT